MRLTLEQFRWTVIALAMALMFMVSSCGTRNMTKNVQETENKVKEGSDSEGKVSKESGSSDESSSKSQNAIVKEAQSTKVVEEYNPDGTLNKRTTETSNKKKTDNSSKERKSLKTKYNRVDSIFKHHTYKTITYRVYKSDKNVERDSTWIKNVGGLTGLFGIALIVCGFAFLYFYLTRKKKQVVQEVVEKVEEGL